MTLPIVHHPAFQAELPAHHRFPMGKFRRLAELLVEDALVTADGFHIPALASRNWLTLAHDPAYVDQVLNHQVPPTIVREIGLPITESVAQRAQAASGGTVLTALLALEHGIACNTAGGSHHARYGQGAGFCVFNDVAVATRVLQHDQGIGQVLIIDLDVHQGDGTAAIFADDNSVFTFSMHAARNYPVRKVPSDLDIALPDGTGDQLYLENLQEVLPRLLHDLRPDLVFFNAGVDPHLNDRLGLLALSDEGLRARERFVIEAVRGAGVPLAGVIGGGYSEDIDALARRHATLHHCATAHLARTALSV